MVWHRTRSSGEGHESGYKCDAAARVVADYYNHTLEKHGKARSPSASSNSTHPRQAW